MVSFSHNQLGTAASRWNKSGLTQLEELDTIQLFATVKRLVVLAAHPDDESLGAGGLIHLALRHGLEVRVVMGSFGEASHPHSPTHTPEQLAQRRKSELEQALDKLRGDSPASGDLQLWNANLPDGSLSEHQARIESLLRDAVGTVPCLLASTYRADGHPDHEVLGFIAAQLADELSLWHLEYPIWYWHWADPAVDGRWRHWRKLALDTPTLVAKREAMESHISQVDKLSTQPGDEALLPPGIREHFEQAREVFRVTGPEDRDAAVAGKVFEDLYRERSDPWDYRSSTYEKRKQAIVLASLPRETYPNAVELGCSIGMQTAALAPRCGRLLAVDTSAAALAQAAQKVTGMPQVSLRQATLPGQWPALPDGSVDLVVLSEIGYFLAADELDEVLARSSSALAPGGELLLCHWLHPIHGWALDGRAVHRMARKLGWDAVLVHEEKDFLLEVLRKPGEPNA